MAEKKKRKWSKAKPAEMDAPDPSEDMPAETGKMNFKAKAAKRYGKKTVRKE